MKERKLLYASRKEFDQTGLKKTSPTCPHYRSIYQSHCALHHWTHAAILCKGAHFLIFNRRLSFFISRSEHLFHDHTLSFLKEQTLIKVLNCSNNQNRNIIHNLFKKILSEIRKSTHNFSRVNSPLKARLETIWIMLFWRNLFKMKVRTNKCWKCLWILLFICVNLDVWHHKWLVLS